MAVPCGSHFQSASRPPSSQFACASLCQSACGWETASQHSNAKKSSFRVTVCRVWRKWRSGGNPDNQRLAARLDARCRGLSRTDRKSERQDSNLRQHGDRRNLCSIPKKMLDARRIVGMAHPHRLGTADDDMESSLLSNLPPVWPLHLRPFRARGWFEERRTNRRRTEKSGRNGLIASHAGVCSRLRLPSLPNTTLSRFDLVGIRPAFGPSFQFVPVALPRLRDRKASNPAGLRYAIGLLSSLGSPIRFRKIWLDSVGFTRIHQECEGAFSRKNRRFRRSPRRNGDNVQEAQRQRISPFPSFFVPVAPLRGHSSSGSLWFDRARFTPKRRPQIGQNRFDWFDRVGFLPKPGPQICQNHFDRFGAPGKAGAFPAI
jgi:hypothetical protein